MVEFEIGWRLCAVIVFVVLGAAHLYDERTKALAREPENVRPSRKRLQGVDGDG